jgi:hypothetical protein
MNRALAASCLALFFSATAHAATITILPGAGFNDSTTFTPVGGNNATTLGQARLNLFQKAASIWAQRITSAQTIFISVKFTSLTCSSTLFHRFRQRSEKRRLLSRGAGQLHRRVSP